MKKVYIVNDNEVFSSLKKARNFLSEYLNIPLPVQSLSVSNLHGKVEYSIDDKVVTREEYDFMFYSRLYIHKHGNFTGNLSGESMLTFIDNNTIKIRVVL